ncbi:hypothetical protein VA249_29930 [Vibrio alfacsensis]|uniref:hypothetical protein n=1 Tax=Vibrio alfacsensis TaxID=1074311 RepID=UPI001BEDA257|nr:hypothetical protein [Vibrio alfacsensis]BBM66347.1 hypothetical protein VA249_29930 [Vibrio alfacsensis]
MALTERQQSRKAWLENAIEVIQTAQLGNLTSGKASLSFQGRNITNLSPTELEKLRKQLDNELTKLERIEQGRATRTVRFIG